VSVCKGELMIERDRSYLKEMSDAWSGTWKDPRDSQRQKVYNSEFVVRRHFDLSRTGPNGFKDVDAVKAWVEKIIATTWWKKNIVPFTRVRGNYKEVRVKVGRRTRTAVAHFTRIGSSIHIELPTQDWAWNKLVILHELAHFPSAGRGVPSHGWLFCNVFTSLVWRYFNNDVATLLKSEYDSHGVRWRRPRHLSDETRRMLSERMTALAAERWDGHVKKSTDPVHYVELTRHQTWLMIDVVDDAEADGRLLDYHLDVDDPDASFPRSSRLPVTKMSITDVAEKGRYAYQDDRMSLTGLLKKMKRHSADVYSEASRENESYFWWLPYQLQFR
jgi:putative metallohydrolase (TIGR04338 family)